MHHLSIPVKGHKINVVLRAKFLHHLRGHSPIPRSFRLILPQPLEVAVAITLQQDLALSWHAFAPIFKSLGEHIGDAQEIILQRHRVISFHLFHLEFIVDLSLIHI